MQHTATLTCSKFCFVTCYLLPVLVQHYKQPTVIKDLHSLQVFVLGYPSLDMNFQNSKV